MIDQERGRSPLDGGGGEIVSVTLHPAHAAEHRARLDLSRVMGDVAHDDITRAGDQIGHRGTDATQQVAHASMLGSLRHGHSTTAGQPASSAVGSIESS